MKPVGALLHVHSALRGLFSRVAKRLGLDPSYVSRVASGQRQSKKIMLAIEAELNKIQAKSRKSERSSKKK
jgi:DNA-binding transcriptional regulator YdaS (Cro superfamily)